MKEIIMKKFLLLGVLVVLLLGSHPVYNHGDNYLASPNGENYKETLPELTVTDLGESGVEIMYKFKGRIMSTKDVEGTSYTIPHIYGFSHMNEVGAPMLPAKNNHIAVPYGSVPEVQILDSKFKKYSKKVQVHPVQKLLPDTYEYKDEPPFEKDPHIYGTDADFPKKLVEVIECDTYMGISVAVIQVRPMQFNPVSEELKLYSKIKFKVTFSGSARVSNRYSKNSKHANDMVKNAVLNKSIIPEGSDSTYEATYAGEKDYIMIVHSNYLAAAQALATWKRQMGYSVEIVSQSSWTTTQVDNALKDRYNSWTPKPQFFLILGDQGDVPAEYTGSRYTDLYYAEMDGSGYKPEMAYGRIFPSSASNAQAIVDKIIDYEKTPPTLSSFYNNTLACAYYQDSNLDSYADRRFTHTSEDIRDYMMGQGYGVNRVYVTGSSVDPIYYNNGNYSPPNTPIPTELRRPTFAWNGDAADIINYVDAGRFLVWHRDHGDVTLWGDPYFTTSNINQLNNGSLLPIVMSVNCLTGQFTGSTECFCERFLRKDPGGCVGIFGATNVSYSGPNDGYAPGIIDAVWPDPGIDPQYGSGGAGNPIPAHDPIYTMGDVLNHSKVAMEYLWGVHQTTWELHHWYGDPAMKIWTAAPTTATATHDTSIPSGGTSLQVTGSNCGGGLATLVYEDTLVGKTTLAGDGTGTITFSALSGAEPTATLTISKHNYKPYIATINVGGGAAPVADFTADTTTVMAGGSVTFTDLSSNNPTSWDWTFEGGTPSSSTSQNPTVTYNTPGTYNVTLTASNSVGSDTETKTDYITVTSPQPPVADFTASSTNISAGDSVTFTDTSINNPTSWSWSFEGGTPATSTDQNPTVTYNTAGTYDVTLTATNAYGSDSETKLDYIDVSAVPYCTSSAGNQGYEYIAGVVVGDLNNTSGASGYTDFTNLAANVTQDATVSVSLTPGFTGSSYTEYWKIWIDYNGDHDFEDSGEEVFAGSGSSVVSGNFTVPTSTITGDTRMRVSMSYSTYPPYCGTFTYGEVEDYTVNITPVCTQYTLTTNTVGNGSITLDPPGGTYCEGTVVTLTAVPDSGWQFDNWSGDLSGTQNPTTITMGSNKTVTANFSQIPVQQYTLTVNTVGQGSVTLDPPGGTYNEGTVVTLTAVADSGWQFDNWSGDLSGSTNPTTITMDANKTVTANFSEVTTTYTVGFTTVFGTSTTTANRRAMPFTMPENGTISSVSMYHTGGSGSMILGVYDGESLPANRLGVTATTAVSGSTGWQTINLTSPAFVAGGSTVWLAWVYESNPGIYYETGSPGRAHSDDTWSGGMPDPFGSSTQADFLYSIYATYTPSAPPQYTLTVNTVGQGSVTLNPPGGTYDSGTVVTLTANPDSGWQFDNWSGDLSGSTNPTTITMTSNKTVTANFSEVGTTGTVGYTTVYSSTSVSDYRRAMPFTMPENGVITSVTMYHTGGSGSMILAVYDGEGTPQNRLAVTPTTAVSGSTGWQTINLTGSAAVSSGQTVWLAWVYESNPGIQYEIGDPGRYQSGDTWSGGMPDPFGSGSQSSFLYSIYATYNK